MKALLIVCEILLFGDSFAIILADDSPGVKVIAEALEKTDDLINEPAEGK